MSKIITTPSQLSLLADYDAARIMHQVLEDVRGDVLWSYPGKRERSTPDLFRRSGSPAFALYLSRMKKHSQSLTAIDPDVPVALDLVRECMREAHIRIRNLYKEGNHVSLTQMFDRHAGAEGMFESYLGYFKRRAVIRENPLATAGIDEQMATFVRK